MVCSAIIAIICTYPPLYKLLEIGKNKRLFIAVVLSLLIMLLCYRNGFNDKCWIDNLRWAFKRTVSFVIGMGIAPYVKQNKRVNPWAVMGICALFYFIVHKFVGKDVFMNWCKIPFLLVAFVYVLRWLNKKKSIYKFICWMGVVSLESYLANIYLCGAVFDFSKRIGWNDTGCYIVYLLVMVLGVLFSWIVNVFSCKMICRTKCEIR